MISVVYGNVRPVAQALPGSQHLFAHIHAGIGSHRDFLFQIALVLGVEKIFAARIQPLELEVALKSVSVAAIFWPALDRSATFAPLTHSPGLSASSTSPAIKGRGRTKCRIATPPDAVARQRLRLRDFKSFPEQLKEALHKSSLPDQHSLRS
jgi:hypothetical protein